jgi:hypothetical protein
MRDHLKIDACRVHVLETNSAEIIELSGRGVR